MNPLNMVLDVEEDENIDLCLAITPSVSELGLIP
jgi:hypothetical protein